MEEAIIALGSNIPPRRRYLAEAIARLAAGPDCLLFSRSRLYETEPVGGPPQGLFLNAAVRLRTGLTPGKLLARLLAIEADLGRRRGKSNEPRTLDLDLIFYGTRMIRREGLEIPHPRFRERGFVLYPLEDIIPDFADPVTGLTVAELARRWRSSQGAGIRLLGESKHLEPP